MPGLVAWSFAKASKSCLLAVMSKAFVAVSARFAAVSFCRTVMLLAVRGGKVVERCSQAVDGAGWCREDGVNPTFAAPRCL